MSIEERMETFEAGDRPVQGYLAEPREGRQLPSIIVVQEWWGLNDHIKDIARRFAGRGYAAMAPDLYEGKRTKDPEEAGRLMQGLDQERAIDILNGAISFLKRHDRTDGEAIGITGFCMGGTFALLLPCKNTSIKAAAAFYGDVPADDLLSQLSAPVLFIGAENDRWINQDKIERLENGLEKFGKEGEVKVYPGVDHAFFNDTRPEVYDERAAEDAWQRVNDFFDEKLKQEN